MKIQYIRLVRTVVVFAGVFNAFPALLSAATESTSASSTKSTSASSKSDASSTGALNRVPVRLPSMTVEAVRLEEVEVSDIRGDALTMAPTSSNLDTYQPQSIINLQFIANNLAPTADYGTIANIAPSVSHVATNGAGLTDARRLTIRGFNDGQYNVTYDGIPFADTNDFTHHTTSYFPAKMIGRITIDRGPGTASTIGHATFGGTIALSSKDPRTDFAVIPTLSYGSYNTAMGHLEANTGLVDGLNGASAIASYQYLTTDGYQTNVKMKRDTTYLKYLQPIGKNTTITFLSNYNDIAFNNPGPITQAQIDTYGRDFGLTDDETDARYWGYNNRRNQTDFEYLGFNTTVAETWHIENKLYTYYYNNGSYDTASIGTRAWNRGDNIGRYKLSLYRSWGDTLNFAWDNAFGTLKFGTWYEYHRARRYQFGLNYTEGRALDYNPASNPNTAYFYNMVTYIRSNQSFVEYDWRVNRKLTLNGGLKYIHFKRKLDASINATTRTPLYYTKTSKKTVGSLAANYSIQEDWTMYAQWAQGFLAPNLNQFYVPDPTRNTAQPQQTTNYQVGTVYKKNAFNADINAYYIDYKNFPRTTNDLTTGQTIVTIADGATLSGVEAEGTYFVGHGTSLYANGSSNSAKYKKSKLDVDLVPKYTASLGVLYDQSGLFGSLIAKYVGESKAYASATEFNPDNRNSVSFTGVSKGYWITDFGIGYGLKLERFGIRSMKLRLEVNNLLNDKAQVLDSISRTGVGLFNVLPTRNYFITLATEF